LSESSHIDPVNNARLPAVLNNAFIAVNASCENLPTATPTLVPTPTPLPTMLLPWIVGDVDCDSAVNAIDSLKVVWFELSFAVSQSEPCPDISASL
jgi:hypothetical protein